MCHSHTGELICYYLCHTQSLVGVDFTGRYGGRSVELDGPTCGGCAEPTGKLVGGVLEAAAGEPGDSGVAGVTDEPAGRGHGGPGAGASAG